MEKTRTQKKNSTRTRRHARVRAHISGDAGRPRLTVFRSNKAIYVQLIDDEKGVTLAAADSRSVSGDSPLERARVVGEAVAKAAKSKKITNVVFDRGGFLYTGQVRAVAEGARTGGLNF